MGGLRTPNIIPPWATSLLGGARRENATPAQQPASRNSIGQGRAPPNNDQTSFATTVKVAASASASDGPGSASESSHNESHLDDNLSNESQQPSRSTSTEPVHIVSDVAVSTGITRTAGRLQSEPTAGESRMPRKPARSIHSVSSRMQELQKAWEHQQGTRAAAPRKSGRTAAGSPRTDGLPSDQDPLRPGLCERAREASPSSSGSGANMDVQKHRLATNGNGEATLGGGPALSRKRPLPDAASRSPGSKRRLLEYLNDTGVLPSQAPAPSRQASEIVDSKASGSDSRPTIIKINRAKPPPSSSEEESDDSDEIQSADDDEEIENEDAMNDTTRLDVSALGADVRANGRSGEDDDAVKPEDNLTKTAAGRMYTEWPLPDGSSQHHNGGLCPTNYKLWHDPIYPYICPVRDCRSLSTSVPTVSAHMTGKHWGGMYNDNGDGTISFIKFYRNLDGSSPPIVITRHPLRADALPPAEAFVNERTKKRTEEQMQKLKSNERAPASVAGRRRDSLRNISAKSRQASAVGNSPKEPAATSTLEGDGDLITEESPKNEELYAYLLELLPPGSQIRKKQHIGEYLQFPKLRDLPPWWSLTRKSTELSSTIASVLLYLTGSVSPNSCSSCVSTPNTICILPPEDASAALKQDTKGCGGCWGRSNVWHVRNACSFLAKKGSKALAGTETSVGARSRDFTHQVEEMRPVAEREAVSEPWSEPDGEPTPLLAPGRPVQQREQTVREPSEAKARSHLSAVVQPGTIISGGTTMSADMLEMEDWEVAPGRIRDESGPAQENIAFSNSYLTTNQTIPISPDVSFNVVVLKPGSSTQWPAAESQLRVCSVATGKVRVKMDGAEFVLGPNGMFKVRAGVKCSATNRLYVDAVLHISTIAEF